MGSPYWAFFQIRRYRCTLLLFLVFNFVGLFLYVDHLYIKAHYKRTLNAKDKIAKAEIDHLHPAPKFRSSEFTELLPSGSAAINQFRQTNNSSVSSNDTVEGPDEYPSMFNWPTYCRGRFRTYAVVSADTNVVYSFPLPITVLSWRKICAGTIVLFIGEESKYANNPKNAVVLRHLRMTGAVIRFIPTTSTDPISLAQTSRLFAAALKGINTSDDAYLVTTDADMLIIKREDHIPDKKEIVLLFNTRCCETISEDGMSYRQIPMHTIGMQAWRWREMMELAPNSITSDMDILNYLTKEFDVTVVLDERALRGNQKWSLDQKLVSKKMHMWSFKGRNNRLIYEVYLPTGRIDRPRWPDANSSFWDDIQLRERSDAHLPHPMYGSEWLSVRKLVKALLPADQAAWAEAYHQEFMAAQ